MRSATETPARRISTLERQLREADDRASRLHRALVLIADLRKETGSLEGVGRLVHAWCGGRLDSVQRYLRMVWFDGKVPGPELVAKLQAASERDAFAERKARLAQIAARVEVDLAAIDAAEAGTRADRLDAIG